METMVSLPPEEMSRVTVRLPLFWAKRPAVWFVQAEEQFTLTGISSERTKFCDHWYTVKLEDILTSPPV